MEHIVHGCRDCPYNHTDTFEYAECYHPKTYGEDLWITYSHGDYFFPDFCPLKTEPITISINSTNKDQ